MTETVTLTREELEAYTREVVRDTLRERDEAKVEVTRDQARKDKQARLEAVRDEIVERRAREVEALPFAVGHWLAGVLGNAAYQAQRGKEHDSYRKLYSQAKRKACHDEEARQRLLNSSFGPCTHEPGGIYPISRRATAADYNRLCECAKTVVRIADQAPPMSYATGVRVRLILRGDDVITPEWYAKSLREDITDLTDIPSRLPRNR